MYALVGMSALAVLMVVAGANADDGGKPAAPPKLEARFYQQETPFSGEITRGIIVAQVRQFSFVLPGGFRQKTIPAERKISLVSTSYTCEISAKIFEVATDGEFDFKPDSVRAQLLAQFKEAKVVDEFSGSVESMSGPAFEVEWSSDAGMKMTTRAAFVPHPGGHIEFVVQAPSTEIRKYDQSLNQLLLSIRSSPVGEKLAVQEFLSEQ